jgi:glycosyltransferase involved in cell wall biosynthesis
VRIAVDYTAAARQRAGIGRYARELVHAVLREVEQQRHHMDMVLLAATGRLGWRWAEERDRLLASGARLTLRTLPLTGNWVARFWQRLRVPLPAELITGAVDLFYSPDFLLPPLCRGTRALLTVHDLSFLRYPDTFSPKLRRYLERGVPRSVARADHVLADSESTRRDLIELLDVPPAKVTALHAGVAAPFGPEAQPEERDHLRQRYGVGARPYVLAVGTIQPRKNYRRLMAACDPLAAQREIELVLVGAKGWLSEPIIEAAEARPYVRRPGYLDEVDLPALYRQAAVLAFPSLYEGFGFPPLEAMACGTPVVASTASSVPEVVGDAGLLVDPEDTAAWTSALTRALDDATLRADLRQAGFEQAAQFTWERTARQWLTLVEAL